jgi:hypothetical protein
MIYVIKEGDTANSIAQALTIGGKAYGPAILEYNNLDSLADYPAGNTLIIPQEWLKESYPAKQEAKLFGIPASWVMIGGALIYLITAGAKR